jgi:hypothetical protein
VFFAGPWLRGFRAAFAVARTGGGGTETSSWVRRLLTPPPPQTHQPQPPKPNTKRRYFLRKLRRVKKANGQVIAVNEIFEKRPTVVDNYGIWVRYQSRTGE